MTKDKDDKNAAKMEQSKPWVDRYYAEEPEDWSDRAARKHGEAEADREKARRDAEEHLRRLGRNFPGFNPGDK